MICVCVYYIESVDFMGLMGYHVCLDPYSRCSQFCRPIGRKIGLNFWVVFDYYPSLDLSIPQDSWLVLRQISKVFKFVTNKLMV